MSSVTNPFHWTILCFFVRTGIDFPNIALPEPGSPDLHDVCSTIQGLEAERNIKSRYSTIDGNNLKHHENKQITLTTDVLNECLSSSGTLCITVKKTLVSFSIQTSNRSVESATHPLQPDVPAEQTLSSVATSSQVPTHMNNISNRSTPPMWCALVFPDAKYVYFHEQTCSTSNALYLCEPDSRIDPLSSCPLHKSQVRRTGCETVRDFLPNLRTEKRGLIVKFKMGNFLNPYVLRLEIDQSGAMEYSHLQKLQNYLFSPTFGK